MSKLAKALTAAAGNAAGESLYVEDVFSTYLYTGSGAARDITNGIDLDGEGGLVWIKGRGPNAFNNILEDTARGANRYLRSNTTNAELVGGNCVTAFNTDGFTTGTNGAVAFSGDDYASWTFRKAEKFFDVVTYTGTGSTQNIAHNLGSVPACIIVKRTDGASNWAMYHTSLGNTKYMTINNYFGAAQTDSTFWNNTSPTDSQFTVGSGSTTNQSGGSYVAYIFASEDGGFGADGTENIIKCGTFNSGSSGFSVDLGFEPQWILIKDLAGNQYTSIYDTMRGWVTFDNPNGNKHLRPSVNSAEGGYTTCGVESTGFKWLQYANTDYIYIAIRRPMKTPESGTEVFAVDKPANTARSTDIAFFEAPFAPDAAIDRFSINGSFGCRFSDRLRGAKYLFTNATDAEASNAYHNYNTYMEGFYTNLGSAQGGDDIAWMFKRATGFFDVVAYTGTGTAQTLSHNLGATPEMVIVKRRDGGGSESWVVQHSGLTGGIGQGSGSDYVCYLNSSNAQLDSDGTFNFAPTSTTFALQNNGNSQVNASGGTYIAYLFATLAGVSKVGSYTGNGGSSVQQIDCGFSSGARFILIKDADGTNDWYVWDSARGIVAGNDPYLRLNQTAAENPDYDWVDPYSAGFEVTTDSTAAFRINVSGRKYIFLAIA